MPARITLSSVGEDGQVTCECNPSLDCCLFPVETTRENLPDTITLNNYASYGTIVFSKNTGEDELFYGSLDSIGLHYDSAFWYVYTNSSGGTEYNFGPCLIQDEPENPLSPWISDDFSSSYSLTFSIDGDSHEVIIIRQDLCSWSGESGFITVSVYYDSETGKFSVLFSDAGLSDSSEKEDPQNTPVGSYANVGSYAGIAVS